MSVRQTARMAVTQARDIIESRIRDGSWPSGMQLPTERDLADSHGVSRNTVRRLLAVLEAEGWIERHVGRGTFVKAAPVISPEIGLDSRTVNPAEVMEARQLIEPLLAKLVVLRASEVELERLRTIVENGGRSASMADFEHWDNQFHRAIAEATKNQYLIKIVEGIHQARQSRAWSNLRRKGLTDERRRVYQADHEAIVAALSARNGDDARDAILSHLIRVQNNLMFD